MDTARAILDFWIDEVGPERWYASDPELDETIRKRFLPDWEAAMRGEYDSWSVDPERSLALVILLDQFPRNMFRGEARAFASDRKAIEVANLAIDRGFDLRTPEPQRQFFYLPFMHSECLTHQERCVRLMKCRMRETGEENFLHAKAHRAIIRLFGRFPYRNAALGRTSTAAEERFMAEGGYGAITEELKRAA